MVLLLSQSKTVPSKEMTMIPEQRAPDHRINPNQSTCGKRYKIVIFGLDEGINGSRNKYIGSQTPPKIRFM